MLLLSLAVGKAAETVRAAQLRSRGHDSYRRLLGAKREITRVHDGGNQPEESQLPRATRRYTAGARGDRVTRCTPKEREKQAMTGVLLIPAAVAVILFLLYLVTRGDDEGDDRGILGVLIDLLRWW